MHAASEPALKCMEQKYKVAKTALQELKTHAKAAMKRLIVVIERR